MQYTSSVTIEAPLSSVLPHVNSLDEYPAWMPLIHSIEADGEDVWIVELRAKVGVFARSKRIRMRRTTHSESRIVFERDETDGRNHSPWVLSVELCELAGSTEVTMNLSYGGTLWTAGVLDRILASQVDVGKQNLVKKVHGA